MYDVLTILIAYFIGAVPFGYLIPKLFGVRDVREFGSGNVGATNAYRSAGPAAGILVLIFDIGKGVVAVMLARLMPGTSIPMQYLVFAAGMAAILGHIFTLFLRFKGGKGVNTALGVMITILPLETLVALIAFIIVVSITRYISFGSMLAASALFIMTFLEWLLKLKEIPPVYVVVTFLLVMLIIFSHRSNIRRLRDGNENRFSLHSKPKEVNEHA